MSACFHIAGVFCDNCQPRSPLLSSWPAPACPDPSSHAYPPMGNVTWTVVDDRPVRRACLALAAIGFAMFGVAVYEAIDYQCGLAMATRRNQRHYEHDCQTISTLYGNILRDLGLDDDEGLEGES